MYHRIISEEEIDEDIHHYQGKLFDTIVTLEQFEEQMKYLHDNNFTTLTLAEFQAFMDKKIEVPKKSVLITFDDGWKDNFANAYPVLDKYGFKATIFLITSKIEKDPADYDPKEPQYLSQRDIIESNNVFTFANHTHAFHERDDEGRAFLISKDKKSIKDDLQKAIKIIGDNNAFAYPFGEYDEETMAILKELDIPMAFTVIDQGMVHPDDNWLELSRRGVYPSTTMEIFKNLVTYDLGEK